MQDKTAIIIGAGPAGLTTAYELLKKSAIKPVIYEMTDEIGGISKTYNHNGNRMDMGGHRFFSKSDTVMEFWQEILPLQGSPSKDDLMFDRKMAFSTLKDAPDPQKTNEVMLIRNRLSRIFYLRKFFDYPVALNGTTIKNLGMARMAKIGFSYLHSMLFKIKNEKSLEDFMINRFGKELYNTFFRDYTYKVWGVHPSKIPADWGVQRIKELSVMKVLLHAVKSIFQRNQKDINQKNIETSLIENFLYPKYGPGQLWETVAQKIEEMGGEIHKNCRVSKIHKNQNQISAVDITDSLGNIKTVSGDYFISSMPVKELIADMQEVPNEVRKVSEGLVYRDFITVGVLAKKLKLKNETDFKTIGNIVPDNWIYIQERDVKLGRLQVFNNWSPYMVKDVENSVWIGLEYFCNENDELWNMSQKDFIDFAISELEKIDIIDRKDVLDSCQVKVKKAYPAYFGSYDQFDIIKDYVNTFPNLYLVGRNGMHKYNNMDHSMLTAMAAVDAIISGNTDKEHIWQINAEKDYHEAKKEG